MYLRWLPVFALLLGVLVTPSLLRAADLVVDGGTYTVSGDTSFGHAIVGNSGTGTVLQSDFSLSTDSYLELGAAAGSHGYYYLDGGTLAVSTWEVIGVSGTGRFTQTGGSHYAHDRLELGMNGYASGTYTLTGGSLTVKGYDMIGGYGTGEFLQSGGTHATNDIILSYGDYSSGTYVLSGGSLVAGTEEVVCWGAASKFTQTGGTNTVTGNMYISNIDYWEAAGVYELSDGLLSVAGNETLGLFHAPIDYYGVGNFTQSGGTHTVGGTLTITGNTTSTGFPSSYRLEGGSLWAATINLLQEGWFHQDGGTLNFGLFNHENGVHKVTVDFIMGRDIGATSTYILQGGSLTVSGNESVGSSGSGTFTQEGGTHAVSGDLRLGTNQPGSGAYELKGGRLSAANEYIGYDGCGSFTQEGGTHKVSGELVLARSITSRGSYTLTNGSLSANNEFVGYSDNGGSASFTQSGGTNTVTGTLSLSGSGTYNLEGGSLSAASIEVQAAGAFKVSGGTQTVTGNVTNEGTVKTTNTDVTWNGTFTNNGVYISDPATQTFSDLTVGSGGCLVAGNGDLFKISGNFVNESTLKNQWDTAAATLQFIAGTGSDHNLSISGADYGPTTDGYTDNFAWGSLDIAGQTVHLLDGSGADGGALYLKVITGLVLSDNVVENIFGDPDLVLNIYYDPTLNDLGGLTYDFMDGKGQLRPTPLPAGALLLGSGLIGLGFAARRRKRQN